MKKKGTVLVVLALIYGSAINGEAIPVSPSPTPKPSASPKVVAKAKGTPALTPKPKIPTPIPTPEPTPTATPTPTPPNTLVKAVCPPGNPTPATSRLTPFSGL